MKIPCGVVAFLSMFILQSVLHLLSESTKKKPMNVYLTILMLWLLQSSVICDSVCALLVISLHFLCFLWTGESDEREQSKLEVKVWDPNSPLTDRQIDQFLVVARWVWHYWVKISYLPIKEFIHTIFSLYSAFFIGCIFSNYVRKPNIYHITS